MRHHFGSPSLRRAATAAFAAALVLTLVAPVAAYAVTVPQPTISISTKAQSTAAQFKLDGRIARSAAGKTLVVEVKKPGQAGWSYSSARTITSAGYWMYRYMPRLKGNYSFRARYTTRYGTRYSGVRSMLLKTQPVWDLYVASTTSTSDSGLFETIIPLFERQYPYWRVKVLSLGSGDSIKTAYYGTSDMLFTHEPGQEATAVIDGVIKDLHSVMYNDFLLVGPSADPAGIKSGDVPSSNIKASLEKLRTAGRFDKTKTRYVTRTGTSGTAVKNTTIWKSTVLGVPTGTAPDDWYVGLASTVGMGSALINANNQTPVAYILTDRATWLNVNPPNIGYTAADPAKSIMCENDPTGILKNPYSVSLVTKPKGNPAGAVDFSNWVRGPKGQAAIASFGVQRFGKPLFTPWVPPAAGAF